MFILCATLLALATLPPVQCAARTDFVVHFTPSTQTSYGSWGDIEWCPAGTYATQFDVKYAPDQGNDDDPGATGVGLICAGYVNGVLQQTANPITSKIGTGFWNVGIVGALQYQGITCNANPASQSDVIAAMLVGVRVKSESNQGSGDDTAANNLDFKCNSGTIKSGIGAPFGTWGDWAQCPTGSGICGLRTLVEDSQGNGDDTGLNKVTFYCCSTDPNFNTARADFVDVLRSPTKTSWGTWGDIEWCRPNHWAHGLDAKVETHLGCASDKDNTGLNAVEVYCAHLTNHSAPAHTIRSKQAVPARGTWDKGVSVYSHITACNANEMNTQCILISSKFYSIAPRPSFMCFGDNVGAQTLKSRSVSGAYMNPHVTYILGDLLELGGGWDNEAECPANSGICGLRTLVQDPQGDNDDTAMNAIEFMCCKYQ